jgi:hypothetical protein
MLRRARAGFQSGAGRRGLTAAGRFGDTDPMPPGSRSIAATALAALLAGFLMPAAAGEIKLPAKEEFESALPEGGSLTGREIFDRFLDNRLHSAIQWQTVVSRDPGGNEQRSRFWVRWKDYRDENKHAVNGVLAKTLVKFSAPEDMRQTGFLMVTARTTSSSGRPRPTGCAGCGCRASASWARTTRSTTSAGAASRTPTTCACRTRRSTAWAPTCSRSR